jgi:hypothetical protein
MAAAKLLTDRVASGDRVLFLTGFLIRELGRPETDGPVGAAALARALCEGLGAVPVSVAEPECAAAIEASFAAAGLVPMSVDRLGKPRYGCAVLPFTKDEQDAGRAANDLLDRLSPAAVVAVERPAANRKGRYHGGGGFDISDFTSKTDALFAVAKARGIATIGVGDLGNELGMGVIAEEVRELVPHGERCSCPCEGGIAAVLPADVAVVANIANWGAYGIAACLAGRLGRVRLAHSPEDERRMVRACVEAGAVDPVTGTLRELVDGTGLEANASLVELLRSTVEIAITELGSVDEYRASWRAFND